MSFLSVQRGFHTKYTALNQRLTKDTHRSSRLWSQGSLPRWLALQDLISKCPLLFIIYIFHLSFKNDFKDETPTKLINVSYFCLMTVNLTDVGANNDNSREFKATTKDPLWHSPLIKANSDNTEEYRFSFFYCVWDPSRSETKHLYFSSIRGSTGPVQRNTALWTLFKHVTLKASALGFIISL